MEIIAHRGASHDAPENTLAAINLAWAQGADAAEIDVQLSSDNRVVVIHDESTKKTAGIAKRVCDQTFGNLCKLDVGRWKNNKWAGERIPTLAAVLKSVPQDKRLFVEVKCGEAGIPDLVQAIGASGSAPRKVALIGFCIETMDEAKRQLPMVEAGWVVECRRHWKTARWLPSLAELVDKAKQAGLNAIDMGANRPLSRADVAQIKSAGLNVYVWTVDSPAKAKKLIAAGVDGITTNRPGWLREQLR